MNDVSIIGRFVRPVTLKNIGEDKCVVNNIVAVSKKRKNDSGQTADFIPVAIWGKAAKIVEKYCDKGNMVGLSGHLISKQYTTSDGNRHFGIEFIAETVHLVEGKRYPVEETKESLEEQLNALFDELNSDS